MTQKATPNTDIPIIEIPERLDTSNVKEMVSGLRSLCSGDPDQIVLDFSCTEYIASAGLRVVLEISRDLQKKGGGIALFGLKPPVRKIFDLSGFTNILRIYDTRDEALKSLK